MQACGSNVLSKPMNITTRHTLPIVALTMGDVAGIGPEVLTRALMESSTWEVCQPVIVGNPCVLNRTIEALGATLSIREISSYLELPECQVFDPGAPSNLRSVPILNPAGSAAANVRLGRPDEQSGDAAYQYLVSASKAALAGEVDAVTTAPLSKAALHLAGHHYPGHTEILAEICGVTDFGMMLYLSTGSGRSADHGLGVVHVTLHTSIRSVPDLISTAAVTEKVGLIHQFLQRMGIKSPRIAVSALNPHAGEEGLFGDEESRLIAPGIQQAQRLGIAASGPFPADTLMKRAVEGEFDGVVVMYHDQGHIALKLVAFDAAVNITLGLPITRTSPSHGTAFDIASRYCANQSGMRQAIRLAAILAKSR